MGFRLEHSRAVALVERAILNRVDDGRFNPATGTTWHMNPWEDLGKGKLNDTWYLHAHVEGEWINDTATTYRGWAELVKRNNIGNEFQKDTTTLEGVFNIAGLSRRAS